jgi:diaminohydroxyphosphoribosylaminopyrimidine deaminase/5-amino-6-(5-phosphoribosylamino)uracil reductase
LSKTWDASRKISGLGDLLMRTLANGIPDKGSPDAVAADQGWMRLALRLANRGQGQVAPNPSVGCILVRDNRIVGRGWTQPGGRPHAEAVALAQAGSGAAGATAYVTLEPCSHHGKAPPCADALIAAGVVRVVAAIQDPDARVDGQGFERLRAAGLAVTVGVCGELAGAALAGFIRRGRDGRPLLTLKLAASIDSRIATRDGESQWITGEPARRLAHLMRARHDAILTGTGTVLADDPSLTCRLPGLDQRTPVRVVLDSRLVTPLNSALVSSARNIKTMIITTAGASDASAAALRGEGVEVARVAETKDGKVGLDAALRALGDCGITSVLVESGGFLAASFLSAGLVDRLVWFRAPMVIGGDGRAAVEPLGVAALVAAPRFERIDVRPVGEDMVETYRLRP